jgi:hypothetical protein
MSRDELRAALGRLGAGKALTETTVGTLDICDRARFAPGDINQEEASHAIDRASEIIEAFERLPPSAGGEA